MKRWRVPAAGVLVALLLLGGYAMGFRQSRKAEIATLSADTKQLRAQQVPLRRDIAGLEQVAAREPAFTVALQHLERLIPARLEQPALLVQLQAAADGAGVKLASVTFGEPAIAENAPESHVPGTVLAAMPLTVVVDGPYLKITDLMRRIEVDLDRAILVGTVALTAAEVGYPQLTGTWSGQVYALLRADDPLLVDPEAPPAGRTAPATRTSVPGAP